MESRSKEEEKVEKEKHLLGAGQGTRWRPREGPPYTDRGRRTIIRSRRRFVGNDTISTMVVVATWCFFVVDGVDGWSGAEKGGIGAEEEKEERQFRAFSPPREKMITFRFPPWVLPWPRATSTRAEYEIGETYAYDIPVEETRRGST